MNKTIKNIILRVSMLIGLSAFIVLVVTAKVNRDELKVKIINITIVGELEGKSFVTKTQVLNLIQNRFDVIGKNLSGNSHKNFQSNRSTTGIHSQKH